MLVRARTVVTFLVSCLAVTILMAYVGDYVGLLLHPYSILAMSIAAAAAICAATRRTNGAGEFIPFLAIVSGMLSWLLWLAWPHLLPIGEGSDLTHHLLLIDYIDRTRHLVHDPSLGRFLGEMTEYTPGMHLLAAIAGSWLHRDGLHAVYPLIALSVALKAGVIFLIALRCLPPHGQHRLPLAIVAVLLLFLPRAYFLGSFVHDSYLAQVMSELFAVTMWWTVVCWDQHPSVGLAVLFAVTGCAAFLTWPVWTGPTTGLLIVVVALRGDLSVAVRLKHAVLATVPIALTGAVYVIGRTGGAGAMAETAGAVLTPWPATFGWLFFAIGCVGAVAAALDPRARTIPALLAAIALQAVVLAFVARRAAAPYLAWKMAYLAVYPLAIGGAYALSVLIGHAAEPVGSPARLARLSMAAGWLLPVAMLVPVGRVLVTTPRPAPVITDDLADAGRWARGHVPAACVDYLTADDDSAYWLHLVILGNPRASTRSLSSDSFDPQKALVRWILPGGLPYAITERFDALPKDIRENVDVIARFGTALVVKRRGPSSCAETTR